MRCREEQRQERKGAGAPLAWCRSGQHRSVSSRFKRLQHPDSTSIVDAKLAAKTYRLASGRPTAICGSPSMLRQDPDAAVAKKDARARHARPRASKLSQRRPSGSEAAEAPAYESRRVCARQASCDSARAFPFNVASTKAQSKHRALRQVHCHRHRRSRPPPCSSSRRRARPSRTRSGRP